MLGNSAGAGREGLLGADGCATATTSTAGERGLAQLAETNRLAAQTEQVGATILGTLGHQRNQLENAIERRQEAHDTLSISTRLIRQMHRRATWIKVSFCLIVSLLLGGLILIAYLHWGPPSHHSGGNQPSLHAGRALQTAASPPPAISTSQLRQPQEGIGPGLITIIVVGALCLLACVLAVPARLAVRVTVFCVSSLLFTILMLFFTLLPIQAPPTVGGAQPEKLTNALTIFRILLAISMVVFGACAATCVLVTHVMPLQRPPIVAEVDVAKPYRDAKV